MRTIVLLFFFLISIIHTDAQDKLPRTYFFPKMEVKPADLPPASRVWVFLMAGQSNMAGRGFVEPADTISDERIITFNRQNEIILAKEPLHLYEPQRTGLDCGLSFAQALLKQIPDSITVLMVPTAIGGSSLRQWLYDSVYREVQLFTNFVSKVDEAKKYGTIKGILWHQGESDANEKDAPLYKERLSILFSRFRTTVGNQQLPILMGELGSYSVNAVYWAAINEQIRLLHASDANTSVIHTDDLRPNADKVHFNSVGQRIIGQRFAAAFLKL